MASSVTPPILMPNVKDLSNRSRKFYDGTYKWNSDGFVDDKGVYRRFDCYDPRSRAPTPLPPMSLEDEEEYARSCQQTKHCRATAFESNIDTKTLTFAPDPKRNSSIVTVQCSDLFCGRIDRERLIGKMEGVLIASKANKVELTLEECYRLCDIPYPDEQAQLVTQEEDSTPTTSASVKQVTGHAAGETSHCPATSPRIFVPKLCRPTSSSSSLSDCPSDISTWDVGIPNPALASTEESKDPQAPRQGEEEEEEEEEEQQQPTPKYTTRSVARKVKRGVNKPGA